MGSWCALKIDELLLGSSKSYVDDVMLSIFHERDRRIREIVVDPLTLESRTQYEYALSAESMRDRLDSLGFTVARARADYGVGHIEQQEIARECLPTEDMHSLTRQTYDRWRQLISRSSKSVPLEVSADLAGFYSDLRLYLRGVLDALPGAAVVVLAYTDLVDGGYYSEAEPICLNARVKWAQDQPAYGPIVILTEGRSDARILAAALNAMVPHLVDLFSFLDFASFNIEGGADTLVKTVRAFVAAGVTTRMVAIFDNDTAGTAAFTTLAGQPLPPNFRAMTLPRNSIGRQYPTIGPQGLAIMDVNGLACSIELYLGQHSLQNDEGVLRPVRWTGYVAKMDRYQGAVEQKQIIVERFFSNLALCSSPSEVRENFPDLATAVLQITSAFARPVS